MQDATPIRLGQEFSGYSGQIKNGIHRLNHAIEELATVPLGGTAVGTGVNTHPEFAKLVCLELSKVLGSNICESSNHFSCSKIQLMFLFKHVALLELLQ